LPSSLLWVSVVLSVPGAGGTTAAGMVVDVVSDVVVCAAAAPVISNKMPMPAMRLFFIVFSIVYAEQREHPVALATPAQSLRTQSYDIRTLCFRLGKYS